MELQGINDLGHDSFDGITVAFGSAQLPMRIGRNDFELDA